MTALPVAGYLSELDSGVERARSIPALPGIGPRAAKAPEPDARIDEAHARGFSEGEATALAELERRLEEQSAAAEERLRGERKAWVANEGGRLSEALAAGLRDIEMQIADQVARVLKPVVLAHVRERAIGELVQTLDGLLSKGEVGVITLSGPEDLLEAIRARVEGKIAQIILHPAPGADLRIVVDETVLETRISAWADAIGGRDA